MGFEVLTYGQKETDADFLLLQMVDDHDLEVIEKEAAYIQDLSGGQPFCLKAVKVNSWNDDLSPWPAPAVFGSEDFGEGAPAALSFLLNELLPGLPESSESADEKSFFPKKRENAEKGSPLPALPKGTDGKAVFPETVPAESVFRKVSADKKIFLGGYSLAGLFALWAGYQTGLFDGIAAASPSIWFPHFSQYMRENRMRADAVYLSLGDREEKTRNPIMSQVGNAIREGQAILDKAGIDCILEWNKGNHFKNPDLRTAKAFAWLMNRSSSVNV